MARSRASKRACRTPSAGWRTAASPRRRAIRRRAMVVVGRGAFRDLPAAIAMHRAGLARTPRRRRRHHRPRPTSARTRRRGRPSRPRRRPRRCWASRTGRGRSRGRDRAGISRPWRSLEKAGHLADVVGCAITLADMRIAQGRLSEAMRMYERGLQLATRHGGPVAARGRRHARRAQRDRSASATTSSAARQHLATSQELGDENGLPQNPYRSRVAAGPDPARRRAIWTGRSSSSTRPSAATTATSRPDVRPVAAVRARVWIARAGSRTPRRWAREQRPLGGRRSDLRARVRARHPRQAAPRAGVARWRRRSRDPRGDRLLARLLAAAEAGGRNGSAIDILVVAGARARMPPAIRRAPRRRWRARIELAEPEGYVRALPRRGAADGGAAQARRRRSATRRATCAGCWLPTVARPRAGVAATSP